MARDVMHISAAVSTDRDAFIAGWEAEYRRSPEGTAKLGVCRHCGISLGDGEDAKVIPLGAFGYLPNICCHACSESGKDKIKSEQSEHVERAFDGIIPTEFRDWNTEIGNNAARAEVYRTFGFATRKGLLIHGTTGSCKTRLAWQIVRLIVEENMRRAGESQYSWLWCDAYEMSVKGIPHEAERVHFLFIDDLGNEPTGTRHETALLHLLRKRCDWQRPTIITTQLTGAHFKARFFEGAAGEAILRRLMQSMTTIKTDNSKAG